MNEKEKKLVRSCSKLLVHPQLLNERLANGIPTCTFCNN